MSVKRRVFSKEFKIHLAKEAQGGKIQAAVARQYEPSGYVEPVG